MKNSFSDNDDMPAASWGQLLIQDVKPHGKLSDDNLNLLNSVKEAVNNAAIALYGNPDDRKYKKIVNMLMRRIKAAFTEIITQASTDLQFSFDKEALIASVKDAVKSEIATNGGGHTNLPNNQSSQQDLVDVNLFIDEFDNQLQLQDNIAAIRQHVEKTYEIASTLNKDLRSNKKLFRGLQSALTSPILAKFNKIGAAINGGFSKSMNICKTLRQMSLKSFATINDVVIAGFSQISRQIKKIGSGAIKIVSGIFSGISSLFTGAFGVLTTVIGGPLKIITGIVGKILSWTVSGLLDIFTSPTFLLTIGFLTYLLWDSHVYPFYVKHIKPYVDIIKDAAKPFGEWIDGKKSFSQAFDEFGTTLSAKLKNKLFGDGYENKTWTDIFIEKLTPQIQGLKDWFFSVEIPGTSGDGGVVGAAKTVAEWISKIPGAPGVNAVSNGKLTIGGAVNLILGVMAVKLVALAALLINAMVNIGKGAVEAVKGGGTLIKGIFRAIKGTASKLRHVGSALKNFGSKVKGIGSALKTGFNSTKNIISKGFSGAKNIISKGFSGAKNIISKGANGAKNIISKGAGNLASKAGNFARAGGRFMAGFNAVNAVTDAVEAVNSYDKTRSAAENYMDNPEFTKAASKAAINALGTIPIAGLAAPIANAVIDGAYAASDKIQKDNEKMIEQANASTAQLLSGMKNAGQITKSINQAIAQSSTSFDDFYNKKQNLINANQTSIDDFKKRQDEIAKLEKELNGMWFKGFRGNAQSELNDKIAKLKDEQIKITQSTGLSQEELRTGKVNFTEDMYNKMKTSISTLSNDKKLELEQLDAAIEEQIQQNTIKEKQLDQKLEQNSENILTALKTQTDDIVSGITKFITDNPNVIPMPLPYNTGNLNSAMMFNSEPY